MFDRQRTAKPSGDPLQQPRWDPNGPTDVAPGLILLGLVAGVLATQAKLGWWWAMLVLFGSLVLLLLGAVALGVRDAIRQEVDAEPISFDPPLRGGLAWEERRPRLLLQFVGDALVLFLCGRFVSGIEMDAIGFAIALAVISIPMIAVTEYLDRPYVWRTFQPGAALWVMTFLFAPVWLVAAPAIADQLTSRFNIRGYDRYLLLVVGFYVAGPTVKRVLFVIRYAIAKRD
jgi:hypothetical protein